VDVGGTVEEEGGGRGGVLGKNGRVEVTVEGEGSPSLFRSLAPRHHATCPELP